MGFDPVSLIAAGAGGVIGGIQQADAAGEAAKIQKDATAKATADAANLVNQQKADQQRTLELSSAFNSLATYQAKSSGDASTIFNPGGKLGMVGSRRV